MTHAPTIEPLTCKTQTTSMELKDMTKHERKVFFIEMTGFVYVQHHILFTKQAEILQEKIPRFNYTRMRNLRHETTMTFPRDVEIKTFKEVFKERLIGFESEIGEPTPIEKEIIALKERVARLEQLEIDKQLLLAEIARLKNEHNDKNQ